MMTLFSDITLFYGVFFAGTLFGLLIASDLRRKYKILDSMSPELRAESEEEERWERFKARNG